MAPGGGGGGKGNQVFGQTMQKKKNNKSAPSSRYQKQAGNNNYQSKQTVYKSAADTADDAATDPAVARRRFKQQQGKEIDKLFGYETFALSNNNNEPNSASRRGWLFQMLATTVTVTDDASSSAAGGPERSGLDLYFVTGSGDTFMSTILYRPYFYVLLQQPQNNFAATTTSSSSGAASGATSTTGGGDDGGDGDVLLELLVSTLHRLYDADGLHSCTITHKTDLDQPNHLSKKGRGHGLGRPMLQLTFDNVSQLMNVRAAMRDIIATNKHRQETIGAGWDFGGGNSISNSRTAGAATTTTTGAALDPLGQLQELREYDVPYVVRVCTDLNIRAGTWYTVELQDATTNATAAAADLIDHENGNGEEQEQIEHDTGGVRLVDPDHEQKANPTFLAFDIECTKPPLKFPSAEVDEIFMISYMVTTATGSQGYLICSRSVVSQDIDDFEYTPQPKYPGPFEIFNEVDEKALLERFFIEYQRHRPQIVVTYNGDFFDWPYVETRAKHHGMDMFKETGVQQVNDGEYRGRCSVHLDAFHWVQRDSYLPQGAQGLKAVTKYKLGYDPVEVDPEDMVRFAQERPVHMATYSVSDAVATYYLYEKYVHSFIFSLCTIIPMGPEDVLRKGSGTLCEMLLMVQACQKNIIIPNKQTDASASFHKGHLLESETYIGGKVECLESGVYRSDIEYDFDLKPAAFQQLIDNIDRDLAFAIEVEAGKDRKDVVNYDEIRNEIVEELENLRDNPKRVEKPYIYHLDVGAMYPNIILTNRLQPSAMVDDTTCAACDYNQVKNDCKRRMDWTWRGDYSPASKNEYERTKDQLSREVVEGQSFASLTEHEQATSVSDRLKTYSRKAYKKTKVTEEENRKDVVCMRENDFYVDTVRQFRDRRYEYKKMNNSWKKKRDNATDAASKKEADDRVVVYDSLQVAHKCILNSFYGYVMRKGARWRSMEMAGIVTKTGADIITQARILVEQIGRPLELDTDGIWCILPKSFPDVYTFKTTDGSKLKLEYPCVMLNADVHDKFTNHQYQTLVDPKRGIYETRSECSIFFEVDGPYRCMVIPASTEEGKLLKKRYAVFNFDGSLAELKGFELKRRGELELIKTFQSQVFERFLDGNSLKECYDSVADVANHWIDVIDTRGDSLDDDELIGLISENRNMSRQLEDYGSQKGTSQTTARRLGEFLGAELIKDKGLNCKFIISEQPYGAPVTERAIPTNIWKAEPGVMKHFLRKWMKAPGLDGESLDIRNVLDWDYYLNRLGKTIQKIITIPAALQNVSNPVPRVEHPSWLSSKVHQQNDKFQQQSIKAMFGVKKPSETTRSTLVDIEDFDSGKQVSKRPIVHSMKRSSNNSREAQQQQSTPVIESKDRIELSKESFGDWLKQKKSVWQNSRRARKTLAAAGDQGGVDKRQRKAMSMDGFVRQAALSLTEKEWQVIEVRGMTTYDALAPGSQSSGSGDFTVWVMTGTDSLQKISVTVPRSVYISTRKEITNVSDGIVELRKVDKHLPHSKSAAFVYELTMPEHIYKAKKWIDYLQPVDSAEETDDIFDSLYETSTPLMSRVLSELGSLSRLTSAGTLSKGRKNYSLSELSRVERPSEGEYLHSKLSYKRLFLYVKLHPRTKTGIVALYVLDGGSGSFTKKSEDDEDSPSTHEDVTRPAEATPATFDIGASCHVWVVKPGSRNGQRNVSKKHCESLFNQLIGTIQEAAGLESEYACVSPKSDVRISSLNFVDREELAYAGANEAISSHARSNHGATFILLNSSRPPMQLRRYMTTFASFPVVSMSFPPGPAHNPSLWTLPSLNWEQPAVQLCLEAYLFMVVVAYPKRVSYSRYGQVPLGNLGDDENVALYDVSLARMITKNRALSWASAVPGRPDLGVNFLPSSEGVLFPSIDSGGSSYNQEEIWGDDEELVSPVIRRPGCYRSICVDIDVQDLAIAALSEVCASLTSNAPGMSNQAGGTDPNSPNNVALFDANFNMSKASGSLGDQMATSVSLSLVQSLVGGWLRDAFASNSLVADELLHHVFQLVSNPDALLHDPALHRVTHSLMKATFLRMLSELQRLGCAIVFASFHRVIVATNKIELADAEEYINFVIATAKSRAGDEEGNALARVSLRPRQFHSHFTFMDEYNFGTMHLERVEQDQVEEDEFVIQEEESTSVVVPSVVTAWSVMNYLGSEVAQEYFRAIIGRFSKEVLKKQMDLRPKDDDNHLSISGASGMNDQLLSYKKKMISKHFSSYLTRAVGEIMKDGQNDEIEPPLLGDRSRPMNPALEFIKSTIAVLELDSELENEVHILKRSLLAQIGVAEYARAAQWINPCPTFILPDVFCTECHESRDVNLCHVPPRDSDEDGSQKQWLCEDCGTPYDVDSIERRLITLLHRKMVRYQLQDIRCAKTSRVNTRALTPLSEGSAGIKLDISPKEGQADLRLLHSLAELHELESLKETTAGMLANFH